MKNFNTPTERSHAWDDHYWNVFREMGIIDFNLHERIRIRYLRDGVEATREGVGEFILKELLREGISL